MNDARGNIEQWLKTAAAQPAHGRTAEEEDRGWTELSAMMDRRPRSAAARLWKRWLIPAMLALAALALLWMMQGRAPFMKPWRQDAPAGQKESTGGTTGGAGGQQPGSRAAEQTGMPSPVTRRSSPEEKPARAGRTQEWREDNPVAARTQEWRQARAEALPAGAGAEKGPVRKDSANDIIKATMLDPIATLNLFAGGRNVLLSPAAAGQRPVPPPPAFHIHYPRWAVQAGLLLNGASGYGARISVLYQLPLHKRFYLQPYAGASYMGGYKKNFYHVYLPAEKIDSASSYKTDTVLTSYQVKNTFSVDAGIRAGYRLNRLSAGTGLRFNYILQSGGEVQPITRPGSSVGSTAPDSRFNTVFSKRRVPGQYSLSWEIEAAYEWRSGLQTGASYRLRVMEHSAGPAWMTFPDIGAGSNWNGSISAGKKSSLSLQDKGMLEIYFRIPLGKK